MNVLGVAVLLAVVIVTLVAAGNNWKKEQQFRSMDAKKVYIKKKKIDNILFVVQ